MGTRTSDQERSAGKSAPKKGKDTTMPHAFVKHSKVVTAPHHVEAMRFHDNAGALTEMDAKE